jgi:outer membrane immunogenic protein
MRGLIVAAAIFAAGATTVQAADLAARPYTKAPTPAVVPITNWTGLYIGGHVGYGWGRTTWTDPAINNFFGAPGLEYGNYRPDGILGGGQIGINYQIDRLVLGIEGEYSAADIKGSESRVVAFTGPFPWVTANRLESIAAVTGKIGYAFDSWLPYFKGGAAWARDKQSLASGIPAPPNPLFGEITNTRSGWTIGAGLEYALSANWSVKAEYDYYDFGRKTLTMSVNSPSTTGLSDHITEETLHVVKVGVNYRFNWAQPVIAKY